MKYFLLILFIILLSCDSDKKPAFEPKQSYSTPNDSIEKIKKDTINDSEKSLQADEIKKISEPEIETPLKFIEFKFELMEPVLGKSYFECSIKNKSKSTFYKNFKLKIQFLDKNKKVRQEYFYTKKDKIKPKELLSFHFDSKEYTEEIKDFKVKLVDCEAVK
ncbi:MAG: hypothetical protein HW421_1681 [Ignavibacteria bacterium]|nr:hypothetical protein [Ignavibacteria bacterium]